MKLGELIEHNMRDIFLGNYTQNAVEILFPDPFLKNQRISRCTYVGQHNNIDAANVLLCNCFDITRNLIVVLEYKIGAFSKKK